MSVRSLDSFFLANAFVRESATFRRYARTYAHMKHLRKEISAHSRTHTLQVGVVNALTFAPSGKFLVAAIGQEHRLGRWERIKAARNGVRIIPLVSADEAKEGQGAKTLGKKKAENPNKGAGKAQEHESASEGEEEEEEGESGSESESDE